MGSIDKKHVYSYSQLEQFDQCPYSFYLQRIEEGNKEMLLENSFAQQGTLIHNIIDRWAKGQITKEQMPDEYVSRYPDEVDNNWPPMLASKGYASKTYDQGLDYLINFDEFKGFEVLDSEVSFNVKFADRNFVGIIDMILKDKQSGELIVLDHKSKSFSSFKKEENNMYRQQLLYSKCIKKRYRKWPDRLMFNLFKENMKVERPFNELQYKHTEDWARDIVAKIETFDMFDWYETKKGAESGKDFFCNYICQCRGLCPNGHSR